MRARTDQRPPAGDWGTWLILAGRGAGKTRGAAEWVRHRVESGARWISLVGATAADVRDVMVTGPAGILAISPPWNRPRYSPSKRRLTWPNGAVALTFSADEPNRLRGPQSDTVWVDELATFRGPEALDNLLMGLRLGVDPRLCVTTTPRPIPWLKELLAQPTTSITRGTTYDNRAHLAARFYETIITKYEGTRLGQQELLGELLEITEGVWFRAFNSAEHVTLAAEYTPSLPVHLAIDAGVSSHHAAVWFQVKTPQVQTVWDRYGRIIEPTEPARVVTVFADYHSEGHSSAQAAAAIHQYGLTLPSLGRLDSVRLDPYGLPRTGMGITAFGEFARVFGPTITDRWPEHRVLDGLDQVEVLLETGCLRMHPRCEPLKSAFQSYSRQQLKSGEWINQPKDPQHPHEDLMDALRGGIRDRFPGGRIEQPRLRSVHA